MWCPFLRSEGHRVCVPGLIKIFIKALEKSGDKKRQNNSSGRKKGESPHKHFQRQTKSYPVLFCSELHFTCQTPFFLIHYRCAFKLFNVYFCSSRFFTGKSRCQDETLRIHNDFISGPSPWLIGALCHTVWQSCSLSDSVVTEHEDHVDEHRDDHAQSCTRVGHTHTHRVRSTPCF